MREDNQIKTKDMTYIAAGIAALISGGILIYQISSIFVIPGVKYIFMAPYLSLIIYILMSKIKLKHSVLWIGGVFGFVMIAMNVFMTISIVSTAILTELSILFIQKSNIKCILGATLFSGYAGLCGLIISKYFVGQVFAEISLTSIVMTTLICSLFGFVGGKLGQRILIYIYRGHK